MPNFVSKGGSSNVDVTNLVDNQDFSYRAIQDGFRTLLRFSKMASNEIRRVLHDD
jgi:hypothetical protein